MPTRSLQTALLGIYLEIRFRSTTCPVEMLDVNQNIVKIDLGNIFLKDWLRWISLSLKIDEHFQVSNIYYPTNVLLTFFTDKVIKPFQKIHLKNGISKMDETISYVLDLRLIFAFIINLRAVFLDSA